MSIFGAGNHVIHVGFISLRVIQRFGKIGVDRIVGFQFFRVVVLPIVLEVKGGKIPFPLQMLLDRAAMPLLIQVLICNHGLVFLLQKALRIRPVAFKHSHDLCQLFALGLSFDLTVHGTRCLIVGQYDVYEEKQKKESKDIAVSENLFEFISDHGNILG